MSRDRNTRERWIQFKKVNDSYYKTNEIDLEKSEVTHMALIISIILACILGFVLTGGFYFGFRSLTNGIVTYV